MSKHTPGPWNVDGNRWLGAYGVWTGPEEHGQIRRICLVDIADKKIPREERDANATLMAAAPDLLAACQDGLRCLEIAVRAELEGFTKEQEDAIILNHVDCKAMRQAIAKAGGG